MAITLADFTKIWASTSPLTPYTFSDPNYAEGWNFIGSTPPSRQMWDYLQNFNDQKMKYIVDNYLPAVDDPLTLTADDGNGNSASLVLNSNGVLTWNGKNVGTTNWTAKDLTPSVAHTLAAWGFCRCIYNENLGIVTISGLKLSSSYTTPTTILTIPKPSYNTVLGILYTDSSEKICTCTISGTSLNLSGYITPNSNLYCNIIFPVA